MATWEIWLHIGGVYRWMIWLFIYSMHYRWRHLLPFLSPTSETHLTRALERWIFYITVYWPVPWGFSDWSHTTCSWRGVHLLLLPLLVSFQRAALFPIAVWIWRLLKVKWNFYFKNNGFSFRINAQGLHVSFRSIQELRLAYIWLGHVPISFITSVLENKYPELTFGVKVLIWKRIASCYYYCMECGELLDH